MLMFAVFLGRFDRRCPLSLPAPVVPFVHVQCLFGDLRSTPFRWIRKKENNGLCHRVGREHMQSAEVPRAGRVS